RAGSGRSWGRPRGGATARRAARPAGGGTVRRADTTRGPSGCEGRCSRGGVSADLLLRPWPPPELLSWVLGRSAEALVDDGMAALAGGSGRARRRGPTGFGVDERYGGRT